MADNILTRTRNAWNIFTGRLKPVSDLELVKTWNDMGMSYGSRPDRVRFSYGNQQSIVTPLYTRIGIDASTIRVNHVRIDQNCMFKEVIPSGLNNCLSVEANIDQTATEFFQDAVMSLCDEGVIAIVPVDTTSDPYNGSYDIHTLRVGKILTWFPTSVLVRLYNDRTGRFEEVQVSKTTTAICENPFYAVMNEPSSTLRRLIEKMVLLDSIDRQSGGKLDLIIQLPFVVKSKMREEQAEKRREAIQDQLKDSQYGIAYTDATEKITQLNRPVENTLLTQIEYLTRMLYSQLGVSEAVFNGTANDTETLNYFVRTVDPMISAITATMHRTFLTKTARTQGQAIMPFRSAFRYIPASLLPDMADKFTRNEILTSNEVRSMLGYYPSSDPAANELRNKNLKKSADVPPDQNGSEGSEDEQY